MTARRTAGAPGIPTGTVTVDDPGFGPLRMRPVRPADDAALLHGWLTHPKSAFWLFGDASLGQVDEAFRAVEAAPGLSAHLGHRRRGGGPEWDPAFLAQTYDPARHEVDEVFRAEPGDVGMHVLVAPTDRPEHGFTLAVMRAVMDLCFAHPATHRVVVEPDERNTAVHALNAAVGFEVLERVALPGKHALLSTCTRARYRATVDPARPGPVLAVAAGSGGGAPPGGGSR